MGLYHLINSTKSQLSPAQLPVPPIDGCLHGLWGSKDLLSDACHLHVQQVGEDPFKLVRLAFLLEQFTDGLGVVDDRGFLAEDANQYLSYLLCVSVAIQLFQLCTTGNEIAKEGPILGWEEKVVLAVDDVKVRIRLLD